MIGKMILQGLAAAALVATAATVYAASDGSPAAGPSQGGSGVASAAGTEIGNGIGGGNGTGYLPAGGGRAPAEGWSGRRHHDDDDDDDHDRRDHHHRDHQRWGDER